LRRRWAVVTVDGSSMEPTFRHGDRVAVRRTLRSGVSSGDVVVIEQSHHSATHPSATHHSATRRDEPRRGLHGRQFVIKRVAAVAGEPVPDGVPVPDALVPEGKLVLIGDNARASFDSRMVGYFSAEQLLGAVVRRMR